MNKNLFSKLGLLLLSLSLVACGQTNNSALENEAKSNQQNKSIEKNIPQNSQKDIYPDGQSDTQEYTTENGVFIVTHSNTVKGICEFDLAGIYVTPQIQPLNNSGTYSHIDVKNKDNIYIDIIIDVTNLSNEVKFTGDLITAKIKIKSTEYTCFSVAENADNTDLVGNASMNPLEKREIHYVAEVPRTEATGQVEVTLTINGKNYSNKLHLDSLQSSIKENTEQTTQPDVKQGLTEEEYYIIIKEAKQRQQDYIDSINDPKVKQSVQTSYSAAIAESTALYIKYPEDTDTIDAALKRILNNE